MLSDLLGLLRQGGTRRVSALARELETTPELVQAMLDDLTRMGYVRRVSTDCSERCAQCPMSDACAAAGSSSQGGGGHVWVLTEDRGA